MNALFLLKSKEDVVYLYSDYSVRQGLEKMKFHRYTALPVITRDGIFVGCISEGDFLWFLMDHDLKEAEDISILQLIRQTFNPPVFVSVDMNELLNRAKEQNFIPVIDDRHVFIGMITRRDIIEYFETNYQKMSWIIP